MIIIKGTNLIDKEDYYIIKERVKMWFVYLININLTL